MKSRSTRYGVVPASGCVAWVLLALPGVAAQEPHLGQIECFDVPPARPGVAPVGWYSGDTHDHVQLCNDTLRDLCDVKRRMQASDLDVTSVLVWDRGDYRYSDFIEYVTGRDIEGVGDKVIRFGVETSGLNCGEWGHLIGLNLGVTQADIAQDGLFFGPPGTKGSGLGFCSPDKTGWYSAPVAEFFALAPGAVRGYAHQSWSVGIYDDDFGFDWRSSHLRRGRELCLDSQRRLAFPNLELLVELDLTPFKFPLLGAMDVALGNVEFLEVADLDYDYGCCGEEPEAKWFGMYYKLLNAGLRPALSAGTDPGCAPPRGQLEGTPRAWVEVDGPLTYERWVRGMVAGRASLGTGNQIFLNLSVAGRGLGSEVVLAAGENAVNVEVTLASATDTHEVIEIVRNGEVVHAQAVEVRAGETTTFVLPRHVLPGSAWLAARLTSNRAHTAATFVIVDGRPIASCLDAEYWIVWCDVVRKETLDRTGTDKALFRCQDDEVLDYIHASRRVFRALADLDHFEGGVDPEWGAARYGRSSPVGTGPISIGLAERPVAGRPFGVTCLNAPGGSRGILVLSSAKRTSPRVVRARGSNIDVHLDLGSMLFFDNTLVSRRSGFAHARAPSSFEAGETVYAQFFWRAPDGSSRASDALEIEIQAP